MIERSEAQLRAENDRLREAQDGTSVGGGESMIELTSRIKVRRRPEDGQGGPLALYDSLVSYCALLAVLGH